MNSAICLCRNAEGGPSSASRSAFPPAEYAPFSLEWAYAYKPLFAAMPTHPLAFSLPNLWAWKEWMGLEIRFTAGLAWLRCQRYGPRYLAPAGPWDDVDWPALQDDLKRMGAIHQVPELLARLWETRLDCPVEAVENRDSWEYLYVTADLAGLAGKRYHMQRNHVNAYIREHGEPDVRELGASDIPAMLELAGRWHEGHADSPIVRVEVESLARICDQWDRLDLAARGLYLGGRLAAFGIGHVLDAATMGVLYEKAEPGLRGAFPVMTSFFARTAGAGKALLNRAEDMGEPGLRKAKMLYRPVDFQRMYTVRVDPQPAVTCP
jgi:hypothetical protein